MPWTLLFCTSSRITSELICELQHADGKGSSHLPFSPACREVADQTRPANAARQDYVEVFEDVDDSQLRNLYEERQEASGNWIEPGPFAVLDDRSVDTKTVVIQNLLVDFDVDGKESGRAWYKWRVAFSEATQMRAQLLSSPQITDDVYKKADQYLDINGVFQWPRPSGRRAIAEVYEPYILLLPIKSA